MYFVLLLPRASMVTVDERDGSGGMVRKRKEVDFINQDSQWKMIRITGTDEEIRKIIDDVMSDIDRRLSYLEKLS